MPRVVLSRGAKELTTCQKGGNPEPVASIAKVFANKVLTETSSDNLAAYLAYTIKTIQKYPELARVIEAWPKLLDEIRGAIVRMIG